MNDDAVEAWRTALTDREREIASLAAQGLGNQEIAKRLGLADGTVRFQVYNIFWKLGLKRRADFKRATKSRSGPFLKAGTDIYPTRILSPYQMQRPALAFRVAAALVPRNHSVRLWPPTLGGGSV